MLLLVGILYIPVYILYHQSTICTSTNVNPAKSTLKLTATGCAWEDTHPSSLGRKYVKVLTHCQYTQHHIWCDEEIMAECSKNTPMRNVSGLVICSLFSIRTARKRFFYCPHLLSQFYSLFNVKQDSGVSNKKAQRGLGEWAYDSVRASENQANVMKSRGSQGDQPG